MLAVTFSRLTPARVTLVVCSWINRMKPVPMLCGILYQSKEDSGKNTTVKAKLTLCEEWRRPYLWTSTLWWPRLPVPGGERNKDVGDSKRDKCCILWMLPRRNIMVWPSWALSFYTLVTYEHLNLMCLKTWKQLARVKFVVKLDSEGNRLLQTWTDHRSLSQWCCEGGVERIV